MAAREERLTPATRNYVIFGLLFVAAVGLAICEYTDPRERRGESDNALRLLVVTSSEHSPSAALTDIDGFNVYELAPDDALTPGRELLDGDDQPAYRAAIAYADQEGYGFVALDLRAVDASGSPVDWELPETPPSSARYAVFSVGDVAVEGPRMNAVGLPDGLEIHPRLAELDSVRLGLFEHPDLQRLWVDELNAPETQAREVLDSRDIHARRELIRRDHANWTKAIDSWPTVPGSLAGAWERVQAAPLQGGLLLEVTPLRLVVDEYRRLEPELTEAATLAFLPAAALGGGSPTEARTACVGLPERVTGQVVVAPDGSTVVIADGAGQAELFVFERDAPEPCRVRSLGRQSIGDRPVGRPNAVGAMAWNYDDDWLHWWDGTGAHQVRVAGIFAASGPWWLGDATLAAIGERSVSEPPSEDEADLAALPDVDFEPVVVILATASPNDDTLTRVELGTRELFGELEADAPLLDLRPAGAGELLVTTERCPGASLDDEDPCLHRLRATPDFATLTPEQLGEALSVETLGPLPPHVELAAAADGSRIAWIDRAQRQLWIADLRGPNRMAPRRLDDDPNRERSVRISADGRVVLSEIDFAHELGELSFARAFVLDPAPSDPPPPEPAPDVSAPAP